MKKNDPKIINAWCSYDWANSVYNLTITAAIFPVFYSDATSKAFSGDVVDFFGFKIVNSVLYSYAISFSFLIIVVLSPILSGIADYSGLKTRFMRFFSYLGSMGCIGLFFFTGENIEYGILCAVTASVGYAGALVFYNAFLPEIVTEDKMDGVSAKGFAMGYIGSVILLVASLVIIIFHKDFGLEEGFATRLSFLQVGLWWFGFSHIALSVLQDRPTGNKITSKILTKGFSEIKKVVASLSDNPNTQKFLTSFFFYSMGVQTVMLLAPLFGQKEIGMEGPKLIAVVLILQVVAVLGAYSFAKISDHKGNKFAIGTAVFIWMLICIGGYLLQKESQFYGLAAVLGFVMGGIQALSRSTYSKMIPKESKDTASFFSFYDITEKLAIVIGTFSYGIIEQITGSMRNSMIAMIIFFLAGFIFLMLAKLPKGKKQMLKTTQP